MLVPFRFSIGDFIANLNLIDAVKSLIGTHGAKASHQELQRELTSLKNALDGVKALSLDQTQAFQISAVDDAVHGCRVHIEDFVQRNSKFKSLDSTPAKLWSLAEFKNRALMFTNTLITFTC